MSSDFVAGRPGNSAAMPEANRNTNVFARHLSQFKHCVSCGYHLRDLPVHTIHCPECGTAFSPTDTVVPATLQCERLDSSQYLMIIVVVLVTTMCLPAILMQVFKGFALLAVFLGLSYTIVHILRRRVLNVVGWLVLSDELAAFHREGEIQFSIRWRAVSRLLVKKIGRNRWRVRLASRVATVDVLLIAEPRTIAALRAELKRRTGMAGTVGWGTSVRRTPGDR